MGDDNRTLITNTAIGPYCNTVYIETTYASTPNTVYLGTGFILGPSAVEPYGSESVSVSADNVVVSTGFINSPGPDDDWAVIELSTDIGNTTGWLGLRWQSNTYNGTSVTNTGYPAVVNGVNTNMQMYKGDGTIMESYTNTLRGTWDASGGNSGGPVYAYYNSTGYTAIGILTSGSSDNTFNQEYPTAYSTATRIILEMYNLFVTYR